MTNGQKAGPEPPIVIKVAARFMRLPWPLRPRAKMSGQRGPSKKKKSMAGIAISSGLVGRNAETRMAQTMLSAVLIVRIVRGWGTLGCVGDRYAR